jgi:GTPase
MAELMREDLNVERERTMLVGVLLPNTEVHPHDPLVELRSLAKTAGALVADEIVAKRRNIQPGLYIGKGKASQIAERVEQNEIDCVIFDNDLAPGQIRELERIIECKVIDRSELILDIFATHAKTHQSRLQVELAQLEYTYPRLSGMWTHLDRHGGAAAGGGGMGTRGPGERQIETDRRIVQKRVSYLKGKLETIDKRKLREVKTRKDSFCVCLVGYTNAGKSTMMNLLTDAETLVADQLFATLETKTRKWNISPNKPVLLSDTVGFVRALPHHLVASFRATLEEAIYADLLVHVADASHPCVAQQIAAVENVLEELGCDNSQVQLVLNKVDKINDPTIYPILREKFPRGIFVSAITGQGAGELVESVTKRLRVNSVHAKLRVNFRNGKAMQFVAQHANVESQEYDDLTANIKVVIPMEKLEQLRAFGKDVEVIQMAAEKT